MLRPLVNAIDRIPLNEHSSEASYEVIVTTDAKRAADIRDFLNERLETVNYPIRETKVVYRSNDNVEIAAKLVSLAVDQEDLAAVVAELSKLPGVNQATWNVSTLEQSANRFGKDTAHLSHSYLHPCQFYRLRCGVAMQKRPYSRTRRSAVSAPLFAIPTKTRYLLSESVQAP